MTNEYLKIVEQVGKYKTVQNIMHHVNKETLYLKHKAQIRKKAPGVGLVWARSEDIKTLRVYVALNNVSISNENDWIQMAKFHAEWSKKFFDVFVPILRKMELS